MRGRGDEKVNGSPFASAITQAESSSCLNMRKANSQNAQPIQSIIISSFNPRDGHSVQQKVATLFASFLHPRYLLHAWRNHHRPFFYGLQDESRRIPVIFATGERFAILRRRRPLRQRRHCKLPARPKPPPAEHIPQSASVTSPTMMIP